MKIKLLRIILAAALLASAVWLEHTGGLSTWQLLLVYLIPYLVAGYDVVGEAIEGVCHGDAFNEDFLMTIATIGALCIGFLPNTAPEFAEAVFVMLFFQVGELFEHYAEGKSRRSISGLMAIRPDTANLLHADGRIEEVAAESVAVGAVIVVKPGERIPLDGVIRTGSSSLNTVALTGESLPREVGAGDAVAAGCVNISGALEVVVKKAFAESTASRIIALVEEAGERKSHSETFIARFARIYTPFVVGVAIVLAIVPPVLSASFGQSFATWLNRALTFLVISCPCALVISVPLAFFGGIGGASRRGILIKGGNFMDALSRLDTVVFDKTGTLTRGQFDVEAVHSAGLDEKQLLHLAAHVESLSTHPIAATLRSAYPCAADGCTVEQVQEVAGQGIRAVVGGRTVCVGNEKMMEAIGAQWRPCHKAGTIIHIAIDGTYAGHIVIADCLKPDAATAIDRLRRLGISRCVMLTGDSERVATDVAGRIGIDKVYSQQLPADKVKHVEQLISSKPAGTALAFVGDGINDAPVLARADVGIAMGGLGADAAIEAADVVLMNDHPSDVATAVSIARRTVGIAHQNVVFAIGVKLLVLVLAAMGIATMWMAVFADVGVTVLAVFNAMRTLRTSTGTGIS